MAPPATPAPAPASVEEYLAGLPDDVRPIAQLVRDTILAAVPGAEEGIRYQMPVVTLDGSYVVHWAAWKQHLGLYPVPPLDDPLERQLSPRRSGKDTVKVRFDEPVPVELIDRLTRELVARRVPG
jgi:uncharacterized protein YdhG (YjbR/CyaY superfamily)